jgi:hypothetical protein
MLDTSKILASASTVEVLFAVISAAGIYYPARIAWGTGCTALTLWRARAKGVIRPAGSDFAITMAPTLVMFILATMVVTVMSTFCAIGLIGMLAPPGEPRPESASPEAPVNVIFRWALVGGLLFVVTFKNIAVAIAFRVFSWGEKEFAKGLSQE